MLASSIRNFLARFGASFGIAPSMRLLVRSRPTRMLVRFLTSSSRPRPPPKGSAPQPPSARILDAQGPSGDFVREGVSAEDLLESSRFAKVTAFQTLAARRRDVQGRSEILCRGACRSVCLPSVIAEIVGVCR